MSPLTQDTQAVLLLCATLGQRDGVKPLTTHQYSTLARWLHEQSLRPRDFLHDVGREKLRSLNLKGITNEVVEKLLDRGTALAILAERWESHGLWVISRGDPEYPVRYRNYLQQASPPILFGVGEVSLLPRGGLAIVGSRNPSEEDLKFARRVAEKCAAQQITVISGAAKGVDSESMQAAIDQGGHAVGVLAEGLGRASVSPRYHDALVDGHLTLISPYEPDSRWFPHTAMERNKLIYGLAQAALVVAAGDEKGGTWAGATEALRHKRIPVFVKDGEGSSEGNRKLILAGARGFSEESWDDLSTLFQQTPVTAPLFEQLAPMNGSVDAARVPAVLQQPKSSTDPVTVLDQTPQTEVDPYDYVAKVIPTLLSEPQNERAFAQSLNVVPAQAKAWLKRAIDGGLVRRLKKPVRYVADTAEPSIFAIRKHS